MKSVKSHIRSNIRSQVRTEVMDKCSFDNLDQVLANTCDRLFYLDVIWHHVVDELGQ